LNFLIFPLDKLNFLDILQSIIKNNEEMNMFTTNLAEIKNHQEELHRQAAHYRLVSSLKTTRDISSGRKARRVTSLAGKSRQSARTLSQAAR